MKIFDCTTFFNENLMLEVRFNILNKYVDKFIVAEAKYSHSGEKKKLNFDINKFSEFKKKIVYIAIDNEPDDIVYQKICEILFSFYWCPRPDSNWHSQMGKDFKSFVSTNFTTRALFIYYYYLS